MESIEAVQALNRSDTRRQILALRDLYGGQAAELVSMDMASFQEAVKILSSGQRMVISIFADLLANIEKQSLVLFDEPEAYLHPTLLSTLMRLLDDILHAFDSYAIVATHSPIVVQEIPSRSVHVLERDGCEVSVLPLEIESLGENLTQIVDDVFAMNEDDKNYESILKRLASDRSFDDIVSLFGGRLSLNARLFLQSLYRSHETT
jgi:predicted ATPase